MNRINIVFLGTSKNGFSWQLGETYYASSEPRSVFNILNDHINKSTAEAWLFWDPALGDPDPTFILELLQEPADVWHCGLKLGYQQEPDFLKYFFSHWMFIIDPPQDIEAVSWRLSLNCCLIRTEVLNQFGLPLPDFQSLDSAGLDLGYRLIKSGVIIKHIPEFLSHSTDYEVEISVEDQIRFIYSNFNTKWVYWLLFLSFFKRPIKVLKMIYRLESWERYRWEEHKLINLPAAKNSEKISVILPTLNRYDYLSDCLASLRNQTLQPFEIIIVDQNVLEKREPTIYQKFSDLPIKVIWQDETGQCKARNKGLSEAKGNWLFFADDDSQYSPKTLQYHWDAIQYFQSDGSTGLSVPPWEYVIPTGNNYFRLAWDFDTGNALIRKACVLDVGGFDLHYDYGKGADKDLGFRVYLKGGVVIHNPLAVRIHFKAKGGLRNYGVFWNNKTGGKGEGKPPITTIYQFLRYLPEAYVKHAVWQSLIFSYLPSSQVVTNRNRELIKALFKEFVFFPVIVYKLWKNWKAAKEMVIEGPELLFDSSVNK